MKFRKIGISAIFLALVMTTATTAFGAEILAFSKAFTPVIGARSKSWQQVATVTINVPEAGYVVVTASGMSSFSSNAILLLTLATKSAVLGPWQFRVTAAPPVPTYQSYAVRQVFKVSAGSRTFYLNAQGLAFNPSGQISVETGTMTAEFYASADVQVNPATSAAEAQQQPVLESGPRH